MFAGDFNFTLYFHFHSTLFIHWSKQFDEDSNQLLSGSDDKSVKVFDTRSGACVRSLQFGAPVVNLQHKDGTLLTIIKRENEVYWYDMKQNALVKTLSGHSKAVSYSI